MRLLVVSCGLLAVLGLPSAALTQQTDYLARVRQLGLDSIPGRVPTFYSSGARERADSLQKMLNEAVLYFAERIGVGPDLRLAVVNEADWAHIRPIPYGIPWSRCSPYLAVLPADLEHSVVVQAFLVFENGRRLRAGVPFTMLDCPFSRLPIV